MWNLSINIACKICIKLNIHKHQNIVIRKFIKFCRFVAIHFLVKLKKNLWNVLNNAFILVISDFAWKLPMTIESHCNQNGKTCHGPYTNCCYTSSTVPEPCISQQTNLVLVIQILLNHPTLQPWRRNWITAKHVQFLNKRLVQESC